MMLNGALGGLVAITAEPLMPSPLMAIIIGGIGGALVFAGTELLTSMKIDDVVGAIPVHLLQVFGVLLPYQLLIRIQALEPNSWHSINLCVRIRSVHNYMVNYESHNRYKD